MADHAHERPAAELPLNHELSDADPSPILKFLGFLVAITSVIAFAVVFFYNYLERREAAEKTARYPMSLMGEERPLPPPPRLQNYPFQDIKELRQSDAPLLTTYEWIDENAGTVRIPVDRAIELLAERGLPYRKPGEPSAVPPTPPPGAPAGGPGSPAGPAGGGATQAPAGAASGAAAGAAPAGASGSPSPAGLPGGRPPAPANPPKPNP